MKKSTIGVCVAYCQANSAEWIRRRDASTSGARMVRVLLPGFDRPPTFFVVVTGNSYPSEYTVPRSALRPQPIQHLPHHRVGPDSQSRFIFGDCLCLPAGSL